MISSHHLPDPIKNTHRLISSYIVLFISFLLTLTVLAPKTFAQNCTTQYGGGQSCQPVNLTIKKEIKDPSTNNFVDNLSVSSSAFAVGQQYTFRLIITNSSGETFHNITVRDGFPSTMVFVGGPGTYDAGTNTLTITIDSLPAGQNQTFDIISKVSSAMGNGQCAINYSSVTSIERPVGDNDTAEICVTGQGQILGAQTLPVAGINDLWVVSMSVLFGMGGLALLLKK